MDRDNEARAALSQALRLLPDYLDVRNTTANAELRTLARDIEAELLTRPPRILSSEGARILASDLQVDWVVHGHVQNDGTLVFQVYKADGERVHTESRPPPFEARRVGDPWYDLLAARVCAAAFGRPLPPLPEPEVVPLDPKVPLERPADPPITPLANV